jgi:hypothetical protein
MIRKWLAVGIILLFVGTSIIPANAQNTEKETSRGWLYVGGVDLGIRRGFRMRLIMHLMEIQCLSIQEYMMSY